MQLTGEQFLGNRRCAGGDGTFSARNPGTGETLAPPFREATEGEVDEALRLAAGVFDEFRSTTPDQRAALLESIADEVAALGDPLLDRAHAETGLPMPRLTGERARAIGQARLFASLIREGSWVDARIDRADPDRKPLPKPDVRRMLVPIGPVVVFGASNFPLAISVIGSDTVSAFAAGCPVIVKGHPAHPGTCELLGTAVASAVAKCGLPASIFSLLQGRENALGLALVRHPGTEAVAFTGSLAGGRALFDAAAARPRPIPVYAEMGSVNPVFVLPGALAERGDSIAEGYVQSVNLGAGQFCTNPGLLFGMKGEPLSGFIRNVERLAAAAPPATMLHAGIQEAYQSGVERIGQTPGVELISASNAPIAPTKTQAGCTVYRTTADVFLESPDLAIENFGPSSVVVEGGTIEQLEQIAEGLEGQLTATLHGTAEDLRVHDRLRRILERKVGRLIFNGFPTGIEVCAAMHHGGAYPATTHSNFTSIGTASILRFARPLCFQGFPDDSLPPELRNRNAAKIWRLVDNRLTQEDV